MQDLHRTVLSKMKYIDEMLTKLENKEAPTAAALLKGEIEELRKQVADLRALGDGKKVVGKEENGTRSRYYLSDGSVYVVKGREYRYLYDTKSKIVTYEFENGQIERTFENGIKEIRKKDGSIVIKTGPREYDFIN